MNKLFPLLLLILLAYLNWTKYQANKVTVIDVTKENLPGISPQHITHPLPSKLSTGMTLPWHYPFAVDPKENDFITAADDGRPYLIAGSTTLRINHIDRQQGNVRLRLISSQNRKFSLSLQDWLSHQHTRAGENNEVFQFSKRMEGVPLVFNQCIKKIGALKDKCFNISYPKNPTYKNCPKNEGFPDYINESLSYLCGHTPNPQMVLKKAYTFDSEEIYVVIADLETLYFASKFEIAKLDTSSRIRHYEEREHELAEHARQQEEKRLKEAKERLNPYSFSLLIMEANRVGKTAEVDQLIAEAKATKASKNETLFDQLMTDSYIYGRVAIAQHLIKKGNWSVVLDHFITSKQSSHFIQLQINDNIVPDELKVLYLLFTSDYHTQEQMRQTPQMLKLWEEVITKHNFQYILPNYNFYISRMQGADDPANDLVKKWGLGTDFDKISSFASSSNRGTKAPPTELNTLIKKYPFLVSINGVNDLEGGKFCDLAIESEIKSDYFANGVCRFRFPTYHPETGKALLRSEDCLPRRLYPPDGEGYFETCRKNFRAWVMKNYPEHFKN